MRKSGWDQWTWRIVSLAVVLLLSGLAAEAVAQPSSRDITVKAMRTEKRVALIIGNGQYKDPAIRPLRYAVADAKAVYDFLVDPKGGGFPKGNVQLLLDQQATVVIVTWHDAVAYCRWAGKRLPLRCPRPGGQCPQWVGSLYKPYPYVATDGREDQAATGSRVHRGGSWIFSPWGLRSAFRPRFDPVVWSGNQGFGCAQDPWGN